MTLTKEEFIQQIETMTVLELSELVKALEEKFNVSAAAVAMPSAGSVASGAQDEETSAEKTEFDVILAVIGDKKIQVIKEVRAITSLGLKEAKELVEQAPTAIKEATTKEDAEEIKQKIEAVGATVEIK